MSGNSNLLTWKEIRGSKESKLMSCFLAVVTVKVSKHSTCFNMINFIIVMCMYAAYEHTFVHRRCTYCRQK